MLCVGVCISHLPEFNSNAYCLDKLVELPTNIFKNMSKLHGVAFILLVIGGLNWLLVGLLQWDIGMIFGGPGAVISRAIYVIVGLAALYEVVTHKANCKNCNAGTGM